jgi:hypothetical protein
MSYSNFLDRTGVFAPRPAAGPSPHARFTRSSTFAPSKAKPVVGAKRAPEKPRVGRSGAAAQLRSLAERAYSLDAKITALEERERRQTEDAIKPRIGKFEERVDRLERGHTMGPRTGGAEHRLYKLEKRVDSLEGRDPIEPEKIASADDLPGRVDALETRVEALETRAADKRKLDACMGLSRPRGEIRREGRAVVFGVMTREDARNVLAAQGRRERQ